MNTEALNNLDQFCGGDTHHKHNYGLHFTDGVKFLCDNADCYWLLDVIGSYQVELRKDRRLQVMQFWKLKVNKDHTALVTCVADSGEPLLVNQVIPYTDFPLPEIDLWVEWGVVLLPSEH